MCNNFTGELKDLALLNAYVLIATEEKAILVYNHSVILVYKYYSLTKSKMPRYTSY